MKLPGLHLYLPSTAADVTALLTRNVVQLSQEEMQAAKEFAVFIDDRNQRQGKKHLYGFKGSGRANHILGAQAERAVAKFLGLDWNPSRDFSDRVYGDVFNIEVRATTITYGKLIIHHDDKDDRAYVLVTVAGSEFTIRGWMKAGKAKTAIEPYVLKHGYEPSFNVDQLLLESPFDLHKEVRK